jgi:hypothetical protein
MINSQLKQPPPQTVLGLKQCRYLIFDGTFLQRPRSIVALMDAGNHTLITGQYGVAENSDVQLQGFFQRLIRDGLYPRSFTVDGNPQVIKTIRYLWPDIIVQRCLVHIQRQGLSWCRTSPRTDYARELRKIFLKITHINTTAERDAFLQTVVDWEKMYGVQIRIRRERGHVFSDIKRARSMLLRALPDMFHYLENPSIPVSTNSLEGYFSRLKTHYRQHRGLTMGKRSNYFGWYFYFVPK